MSSPGAVTFDPTAWRTLYPAFAAVSDASASSYFAIATIFCANQLGPVGDTTTLLALLNMLTAHIAWLFSPRDANGNPDSTGTFPPPNIVGRIGSATEGSVTLSTEYASQIPLTAAWFVQSPYGAAFWAACGVYRTFRMITPRRCGLGMRGAWLYPNAS